MPCPAEGRGRLPLPPRRAMDFAFGVVLFMVS